MQRYFIQNTPKESSISLTGEIYHHVKNVMRNQVGDELFLVDPLGTTYQTAIESFQADAVVVHILKETLENKELPAKVTIASSFLKGEKMDWLIQKATEIGMADFIGFPSKTSVVKWDEKKRHKKQERLAKIALEASQQSQRVQTPKVNLLGNFSELVAMFSHYDYILVAYEESSKQGEKAALKKLLEKVQPSQSVLAIFGPEGGILPEEIETFVKHGAIKAALGPRILRAETAPLYLLSAASYEWELGNEESQ